VTSDRNAGVDRIEGVSGAATPPLATVARSVARRPSLWWPAVALVLRFAPRGWWRHPPFLPIPDERYWRFRMETAYGDVTASPDDDDIATIVRWTRRTRTPRQ
jgi:hypothetical protein